MATVSPSLACPDSSGWAYALHLPHDARAPRVARMTLRAVLGGHGMCQLLEIAELLVSEVVTNSVRHSDGEASMRLRGMAPGRLRVSVWDTSPVIPAPFDKPPGPIRGLPTIEPGEADGGRGLLLVRLCADNWGGYPLPADLFGQRGKLLWFELGMSEST